MIRLDNLEMRYGGQILFSGVDLQFMPGNRYGLVGPNGAGKSTLLRILSGEEHPTMGSVQTPPTACVGFLRQDHFTFEKQSLLDVVIGGKAHVLRAMHRMKELTQSEHFSEEHANEYAELEAHFERDNGYAAEADAAKLLEGLGLELFRHNQPLGNLSGGFKLRVLLARVLFSEPEVLLLDEPTNHLDLYSIRWLQKYLTRYRGTLIISSHDREFLNDISTHIADVDYGTVRIFKGNYEQFLKRLQEEKALRDAQLESAEKKVDQLNQFITRFGAKASKARQAHSKTRQVEKLQEQIEENSPVHSSRRSPILRFTSQRLSGPHPVIIEDLSKSYGEQEVLKHVSFEINRGDHIAILGPNGIGKSTLLKVLLEQTPHDEGKVKWGHHVHHSYFPQNLDEELDPTLTVFTTLQQRFRQVPEKELRALLALVLFRNEEIHKLTSALSGGEKARLLLGRILLEKPNLIIMDEPTNHLDLDAIDELAKALRAFEGTLLVVSHNRWFVSCVADRIIEITPKGVFDMRGGYQEFVEREQRDYLDRDNLKAVKDGKKKEVNSAEIREEEKRIKRDLNQSEKEIAKLEKQLAELHESMGLSDFYTNITPQKTQLLQKETKLAEALSVEMEKWEGLGKELESLRA